MSSLIQRAFVLVLFSLFSLIALGRAQSSYQTAGTASIEGLVVKEPGSQPLKKVLVQVVAEDQKQAENRVGTTDSDGYFRIDNLDPGRYRLFFEKTGFISVNGRGHRSDSSVLTLQSGQEVKDLYFSMLQTAVLNGRVVDEDGEPIAGANVFAQRKKPGGSGRRETTGAERTNDLGEYRVSGLFPGQYFVVVVPPPDARDYENSSPPKATGDTKPDTRYLTTYYPGTTDGTQASTIALHAGDEMPINVMLIPSRTYRVRGIVAGTTPSQKVVVELVSKSGDAVRPGEVRSDGRFEVLGVAPGSYVVKAFAGEDAENAIAREDVSVVAADVDGLKLVLTRPFTLSGHLRFEGQVPPDFSGFTPYGVNLQPKGESENQGFFIDRAGGGNARADRAGNFQFTNVTAGSYLVDVYNNDDYGSFLKSVTLGNHAADAGFTVSGPASLELVLSLKGATLEGVVLDGDRRVANASVVAVPEEEYRGRHDRYGIETSDQSGRFVMKRLAPGTYTVFAWQDIDSELYFDPDFQKSQLPNGTSIKLEEGAHQTIALKLAVVPEEWQ